MTKYKGLTYLQLNTLLKHEVTSYQQAYINNGYKAQDMNEVAKRLDNTHKCVLEILKEFKDRSEEEVR